jgi:hypothetical protein
MAVTVADAAILLVNNQLPDLLARGLAPATDCRLLGTLDRGGPLADDGPDGLAVRIRHDMLVSLGHRNDPFAWLAIGVT